MASKRITELTALASVTTDDLLLIVDDPAGTPASKKATVATLATLLNTSPALTGTPTAPTATVGTNTTQVATTAFVKTSVDNLLASAPAALDTLNELAAALGNDASFSSTVTTSLAAKAPLASPSLTGTPLAPTASAGTSTTQIATTAFVATSFAPKASPTFTGTVTTPLTTAGVVTTSGAGVLSSTASATAATANTYALRDGNGYVITSGLQTSPPPAIVTATTYTVAATDTSLIFNSTASCTVTLPSASTFSGRIIYMKTIAAFTVISASSNVLPLTTNTAGTAILAGTAGQWAMLHSNGTSWVKMAGS